MDHFSTCMEGSVIGGGGVGPSSSPFYRGRWCNCFKSDEDEEEEEEEEEEEGEGRGLGEERRGGGSNGIEKTYRMSNEKYTVRRFHDCAVCGKYQCQ